MVASVVVLNVDIINVLAMYFVEVILAIAARINECGCNDCGSLMTTWL